MRTRHLPPSLCLALLGLLVYAASASAEVKTGEASAPVDSSLPAEIDIVGASARYDSDLGEMTFTIETSKAPDKSGANASKILISGELFPAGVPCDRSSVERELSEGATFTPYGGVNSTYAQPAEPGDQQALYYFLAEAPAPGEQGDFSMGPGLKSVVGVRTTLTAVDSELIAQPFTCAEARVEEGEGSTRKVDFIDFPVAVQPPPTPEKIIEVLPSTPEKIVEVKTQKEEVPVTRTVVEPTPAALSIARPKPLLAGSAKFSTVRLAVTNTGGTASGPLSLKVESPKGVIVRPGALSLPALLPGQTWTVPVRVKVTDAAKKISTVGLTASLPGVTTTSAIVVKSSG